MPAWVAKLIVDNVVGWIISLILVALSAFAVNFFLHGTLISLMGGSRAWVDDKSENGMQFDPLCEYRAKVTSPSPAGTSLAGGAPQTIYLVWVQREALLQPFKAGWFTVSFRQRGKIVLPDNNSASADVTLQYRCP